MVPQWSTASRRRTRDRNG